MYQQPLLDTLPLTRETNKQQQQKKKKEEKQKKRECDKGGEKQCSVCSVCFLPECGVVVMSWACVQKAKQNRSEACFCTGRLRTRQQQQ